MPIVRKKSSKKVNAESNNYNLIGDVTIDDFANSSRTHARFKKAVINVCSEVKQNTVTENDDIWDEMDRNQQSTLSDSNKSKKNIKGVLANQRNRKASSSDRNVEEEKEGIDYPLDIWFIISEYISPEVVGKFARICRSSYHVTTTGKFWFHLYKSYYRFVPSLPERLQPQCMVRTHGLRACVIRMLHYTYFALRREIDDLSYLRQEEPHSLVKRRCCLMWHKEGKMRWYFYFKLKELPKSANNSSLKQKTKIVGKKTDFLEMLEDVAVNPEEGCKILRKSAACLHSRSCCYWPNTVTKFKGDPVFVGESADFNKNWNINTRCVPSFHGRMVTCLKYSMLPPVTGLILQSVSMTLMPGFKDHRLQLGFGTSNIPNTLTNQVILNDVISCQVLDWWHPCYLHQDTVTTIRLPQSDSWEQSLL